MQTIGLYPASETRSLRHFPHADHVSRKPHVNPAVLGHFINIIKRFYHHIFQFFLDFFFTPVEALVVLNPFKIRNRYTAGARQNIGNQQRSFVCQDFRSFQCRLVRLPLLQRFSL